MKRPTLVWFAAVALAGGLGMNSALAFGHGGGSIGHGGFRGGEGFRGHNGFHGGGFRGDGGFHDRRGSHDRGGFHEHRGFHGHHESHGHFGIYFGAPLLVGPGYYDYGYPPLYDYPSAETVPSPPVVYIEKGSDNATPSARSNYWYYCYKPPGYYPYIKTCPGGWQQVIPRPPPDR